MEKEIPRIAIQAGSLQEIFASMDTMSPQILSNETKMCLSTERFPHKIFKQIVENTEANTIILGVLNVKTIGMKEKNRIIDQKNKANKNLNHSMQNTNSLG